MNKKPIYEKIDCIEKKLCELFSNRKYISYCYIDSDDIVSDFNFCVAFYNTKNVKENIYTLKKEIENTLSCISVKLLDEQINDSINDGINNDDLEIGIIDFYCDIVLK